MVTTSEKISDLADAEHWLSRIKPPIVVRTLREKSRRAHSIDQARAEIARSLEQGPLVIETLVDGAREIETVMFASGNEMPVCLGEVEMTLRIDSQKAVAEYPPIGIQEEYLVKLRKQAAQLILGARWEGIIAARFLVTPDGRPYFLQLVPGIQPWHLTIAHALGINLFDAEIAAAGDDVTPSAGDAFSASDVTDDEFNRLFGPTE